MGIRANALTDHRVADYRDQAAVLSLLAPTTSATLAVAAYWREAQPDDYTNTTETWRALCLRSGTEDEYLRYDGPAKFMVRFGKRVAVVSGPCRWSGFCTMPALQQVHAEAFREISRALGGTRIVLMAECEFVEELALYDGGSWEDCITMLQERRGDPQPTISIVTDDDEVYYRRKTSPYYVERLNNDG